MSELGDLLELVLAHGADRHELTFDAERGVLLRTRSFLEGEPFSSVELLTVAASTEPPPLVA
jgi:hypothetical protein